MPSSTAMPTPSSPHVSAQEDSSSEGISVLIPGRDERDNLPKLIAEVHAALAGRRYEIIVVDDGSSDDSWRWLTQAALEDSRLRPYHHDTSFGQSTSLWQAARLARGEWLATLDGDGQNDPADLPDMLSLASLEGLDMVAGHRTERRDDAVKRVSSRLANAIRQALLHDDTPDTGCGIKVTRRDVFLRLPYFDHMHRFLPALVRAQGGKVQSLPVRHRERVAGVSKYGFFDRLWVGISDIIGVMWLVRRSRLPSPLQNLSGNAVSETLSPLEVALHPACRSRDVPEVGEHAARDMPGIDTGRATGAVDLSGIVTPHAGVARGAH
ncbi:glycosyltransferase family 2 protein [Cobetia marina]|uniref:glycosyltransferase family 2 protein n=1 Tax=Cobetia marina TaxID=28258 RepID=UPI001F0F5BE0|nr:glycosyltransferase family 2 protein [Cobetia marina]